MFGDLIKDIIKSNNRDDIFDFLLQMNDSSVEVNVASDTQLLIYSSKLDDFFEEYDETISDVSFKLNLPKIKKDIGKRTRRFLKLNK